MTKKYTTGEGFPRRDFLKAIGTAGAMLPFASFAPLVQEHANQGKARPMVTIFSKHLSWLDWQELADTVAQIGFDGIDLAVRPKGHVLPENVERDLPKAVDIIKKAGLQVPMMVTEINKVSDPFAEKIIKTASEVGINYYRTSYMDYDFSKSIEANLKSFQLQLKELADMNQHYGIRGACQNHSGVRFSSPIWDLWLVLKEINSEWLGCQFDIRHAVVEGAYIWPITLRAVAPFINTIDIKDSYWKQVDGKWKNVYCPLGEGMVDFKAFFALLKELNINTPICMHFEYDLGLPSDPRQITAMHKDHVMGLMKKDLAYLQQYILS